MSVYNLMGEDIGGASTQNVYIKDVKSEYPSYNDDDLLDTAISLAQNQGIASKIIWDGEDIRFSGSVTHVLKSFGGIDFNGSKIYMPNYDNGIILSLIPETSDIITASASDILANKTTNANLCNKVFSFNNNTASGNSDMCIGDRIGYEGQVVYWTPTIKTSVDGFYETGDLYLSPLSGNVECRNVHEYPSVTFEICNGTIISRQSANMSTLLSCSRSNVHVHNFVLQNRSNINVFHAGIFAFRNCYGIEVDHISGINPATESLASGYFLMLASVTNAYVHDCFVGDSLSWGAIGGNHLMNTVFERCYLNRWDCHYCQTGHNIIRDSVINRICYGVGNGVFNIENCVIKNNKTSDVMLYPLFMREDVVGVYEGIFIVKGCTFYRGEQSANLFGLWRDASTSAKPLSSALPANPKGKRYIDRCKMPDGCKNVLVIGSNQSADADMYSNVSIDITNTEIMCSNAIVDGIANTEKAIKGISIDNCVVDTTCYVTKTLEETSINIKGTDFGTNPIKVAKNLASISVSDTTLSNVTADSASANLMASGCKFAGTQSINNFSAYSLFGNIASDMASVNKHS